MPNPVQTVTIAQALASNASGLLVADTGTNIANALPDSSLTARVTSFTLSGAATLGAALTLKLAQLGSKFHLGGNTLILSDTLAEIDSPANASAVALATGVQAADYAYHLLQASPAALVHVTNVAMIGDTTIDVAQLTQLKALPAFHLAPGAHLTLADSAAHIAALLAAHPGWFAQVTGIAVHLDGSVMASAQAVQLIDLASEGRALSFVSGGGNTTLKIAGSGTDLAAQADTLNRLDTLVTPAISLSPGTGTLTAAQAVALEGLTGLSLANNGLSVADTGANITQNASAVFGHGFAQIDVNGGTLSANAVRLLNPVLHFQGTASAQLNASAVVGAGQAAVLAALPGFSLGGGVSLTVASTPANLVANTASWEHIATAVQVSGDGTLAASGATALAALANAFGGRFSLGGHSITVSDSLANIIGLSGSVTALLVGEILDANANVDAAAFSAFSALPGASLGGYTLTVTDTAANLLALASGSLSLLSAANLAASVTLDAGQFATLSALPNFSANGHSLALIDSAANLLALGADNLSQVSSVLLSASATVTVAQAQILAGEPSFSANGHSLIVSDTAANLVTLPHALQVEATAITLDSPAIVSAAQLTALAAFGVKFFTDGNALTVADTAADLEALSPAALGLASAEILNHSATVSASGAAALAALPSLTLASGVTLTVQDSVGNLLALGTGAPSCVTSEILPAGSITVSAAQAAGLAALPHFSVAGVEITVADTVANLTAQANVLWTTVAAETEVVDSGANLAAASSTALVRDAALVTLSGNATVSAAQAALIADIPHFTAGSSVLNVADLAASIAANEASIVQLGAAAVVTDSGPVTAHQADALALVANAGLLSFQSGVRLIVQDSLADLTANANAAGLALAARITVVDNAANLVAAAAHDWGSINPAYTLNQNGTITGAQAATLAGLGSHYSNGGFSLTVADSAAGVAGAAAAVASLGITATVTDTASAIDAVAGTLATMGARLASVDVSNPSGLSAATAAGLSGLAGKLTGGTLVVADGAGDVTTYRSALTTLGAHVSIAVTDTAANLIANEPAIAALAASATIDAAATVSASGLTTLAQIATALGAGFSENGHAITLSDSCADILALSAQQTALATSVVVTGTILISQVAALEQAGLSARIAGALAVTDTSGDIVSDLTGGGVLGDLATNSSATLALTVTGGTLSLTGAQAATILGNPAAEALMADLVPATIVSVSNVSAAGFAAIAGAGWPHLQVAIVDNSTDIANAASGLLQALEHYTGSLSITLTDAGAAPAASAAALAPFASYLVSGTDLYVSDSAANIANYAGALESLGSVIGVIFVSATNVNAAIAAELAPLASHIAGYIQLTVTSTAAQATTYSTQLGHLNTTGHLGAVVINGCSVADVATNQAAIAALPAQLGIVDTASAIATDLTGGASALAADSAKITSVTLSAGGQVSASALADMAALPGFSLGGHQLAVTGTAAGIDGLASNVLNLAATATIQDSAAHIGSAANAIALALLNYTGSASIVLTDPGAVSAAVAAGLAPVVGWLAGGTSINVSDSAADVVAAASALESLGSVLGTVTLQTTTLAAATDAELLPLVSHLGLGVTLNVADTAANIAASLTGLQDLLGDQRLGSVTVSNDSVADVTPHYAALNAVGATVSISDSAANVLAGLASLALVDGLTTIVLTDGTTPTLTMSLATLSADGGVLGKITSGYQIAISDTAADIQADLLQGGSSLIDGNAHVTSVAVSDGQTVTLSQSELLGSQIGVRAVFSGALAVTGVDVADLTSVAARGANSISVVDNAGNIQSDLASQSSSLAFQAQAGTLASVASSSGAQISLSVTQVEKAGVDDSAHSVMALLHGANVTVTGALVSDLAALDSLHIAPAAISVSDSSSNILADLISGNSRLAASPAVAAITVTGGAFGLTGAEADIILTTPALKTLVGLISTSNTIVVGNVAIGDAATIFNTSGWENLSLTVVETAAQLADNQSELPISAHVQVNVLDSAAAIGAQTANLAYLSAHSVAFTLTLTDSVPVGAGVAAGLGPWAAHLAAGTLIGISDSGANVAANAAQLEALGASLGTITLDSTTLDAAIAAELQPLDAHLGSTVHLDVTGTAAELAGNLAALEALRSDGHLGAVTVANDSVADVTAHVAALNALGASVTIEDSAQNVGAGLAALTSVENLSTITLNNGGTPTVTTTIANLAGGGSLLGAISGNFHLAVADTASDIEADIGLGAQSVLAQYGAQINALSASDALPVVLAASQVLAGGIDNSAHAALAHFSGTLDVTGASVSQIAQLALAARVPTQISVSDTASTISSDLALGPVNSLLLSHAGLLGPITVSDGGTIALTAAQVLAAGVDDGPSALMTHVSGYGAFTVTAVSASDLGMILGLTVPPGTIAVADTTANLETNLASLVANLSQITTIAQTDEAVFTITAEQALTVGVASGAGSVIALMGAPSYDVTGALVSQMVNLQDLAMPPALINVSDTSANIVAGILNGASGLAQQFDSYHALGTVTVAGNLLSLSQAQVTAIAGNGTNSIGILHDLANGTTIEVSGVAVSGIAALVNHGWSGLALEIADSANNIAADLTGGPSVLQAHLGILTSVTLNQGGTISVAALTDMAALPEFSTGGHNLDVLDSAGAVAGLQAGLLTLIGGLEVGDSAADVAQHASALATLFGGDLSGSYSIELTDTQPVLATIAASLNPVLSYLASGTTISVSDTAADVVSALAQLESLGAVLGSVTVTSDSGDQESDRITAAHASALSALGEKLEGALTVSDSAGAITTYLAGLETLQNDGKLAVVEVYGASVADATTNLSALNAIGATVTISDSSTDVVTGLATLAQLTGLQSIELTDGDATTLSLNVGALESDISVLGKIANPYHIAITDSASAIQTELGLGTNSLLATDTHLRSITVSSGGAVTLSQAELLGSAIGDGVTFNGTLAVTGVDMQNLVGVVARAPSSLAVSSNNTDIAADLQSGDSQLAALAAAGQLAGLHSSSGGTIALSVAEIETAGMDDGAHSVSALLNGVGFTITGAHIADLSALENLSALWPVNISDTAANFLSALQSGSTLYTYPGFIASIHLSGTITLTDSQAQAVLGDARLDALVTEASQNTDIAVTGVSIADMDSLLSSGWSNTTLAVADSASAIAGVNLGTLEAAASVTVTDNAGDVGGVAATLATLLAGYVENGGTASIALTDVGAVGAGVAAGLLPVAAYLQSDTSLNVDAAATDVATHASALAALGSVIGTITLTSDTMDAATAATISALQSHLGGAVLDVTGSAVDIQSASAGLELLQTDSELGTVTDSADSVADITAAGNIALLNHLGATITISDSSGAVFGALAQLAQLNGLTGITLTDQTTPTLDLSLGDLSSYRTVLALINSGYHLSVSGTAAAIEADLNLGAESQLAAFGNYITSLSASDGNPVVLSAGALLAAGIDDGAHSALAHFSGTLDVTGVAPDQVASVFAATTAPTSITVSGGATALSQNLALGGGSSILSHIAGITSITDSDGGTISLTASQAENASAALGKIYGAGGLAITAAQVADLASLFSLPLAPTSIAVSDSASAISTDLALGVGTSELLAARTVLSGVTVSDAGTIVLTEAQALAAGVDDGAQSVLAKISGETGFEVTGVDAADLGNVLGLYVTPTSMTVHGSAADLAANFSSLVEDRALITSIAQDDGAQFTISADQALGNGAASVLQKFSGSYAIGDAAVSQLSDLAALPNENAMGTNIAVNDSSDHIVADILLGSSSQLAASIDAGEIASVTVSGGTLALTDTHADTLLANDLSAWNALQSVIDSASAVTISGVTVADAGNVLGLDSGGFASITLAISDSAQAIASDLAGADTLGSNGHIGSVTLNAGGTVDAAALAAMAALPNFSTGGQTLNVTDSAGAIAGLTPTELSYTATVTIDDSANAVGLVAGQLATALQGYAGTVDIDLTDTIPVGAATAASIWTLANYHFTGNALAISDQTGAVVSFATYIAALAGANAIGAITLSDCNTDTLDAHDAASLSPLSAHLLGNELIVADNAGAITTYATGLETLYNAGELASVTVSGASMSDVNQNHVALNAVHAAVSVSTSAQNVQDYLHSLTTLNNLQSITLTDQSTATINIDIADLGTYSGTLGKIQSIYDLDVRDTAAHFQADILSGAASILATNSGIETSFTVTDGNPVVLTQADMLEGGAVGTAIADTIGSIAFSGTVEITGVQLDNVGSIAAEIACPAIWSISDTAAEINTDLANVGNGSILQSLASGSNSITAIAVTGGGTISATAAIAEAAGVDDSATSLIGLVSGAGFAVTDAAVTDLSRLDTLYVQPSSIAMSDLAANIASDLNLGAQNSELLANASKITTVQVSDQGTISLTAAAALTAGVDDGANSLFAKLSGNFTYHVTGAAVSQLAAITTLWNAPTQISVTDSAAHIAADVTGAGQISANAGVIASVTLNAGGTVSEAVLTAMAALPNFSTGGQTVILQDGAANIAGAQSNVLDLASAVHVLDTGSHIAQHVDALQTALTGYGGTVSIAATGTVTVDTTQYTNDLAVLHDITGTGVLTIQDTAAALNAAAATLEADSKVGFATLSADASVTTGVLATLAGLPHFSLGGFTLDVTGNTSDILGAAANIATYATSVTLTADATSISQNIDALQSEFAHFTGTLTIDVNGGSGTVAVNATQYSDDHAVLDSISTSGAVTVSDTAGALAAIASTLEADPVVGATALSANAQVDAQTLATLYGLPSFSLSTYTLSLQDNEADILNLTANALNLATSVTVQDSAADVGAEAAALAALLAQFTNGATPVITLTDSTAVSPGVAAALAPVVSYLNGSTSLAVSGSPTDVAGNEAGLAALGSLLGTISLTSTSMTAATAASIVPLDSHLANGVTLTVTGSASAINTNSAALDQLNTDGHLARIVVQNVTLQDLNTYRSVFDALPHSLQITDTAALIAGDVTSGGSLILGEGANVASVTLTQGGIVSEPEINAMSALPGFALNGYTLTAEDTAPRCLLLSNAALANAYAVQVQDTAGSIGSNIDALENKFGDTAHFSILITSGGNVSVSALQFTNDQRVLDSITTTASVTVTDTAAALAGMATALNADGHVGATKLSAIATVNAATLATLAGLTGFSTNNHALTLTDTASHVLGASGAPLDLATNVNIIDTSADVSPDLAAISALSGYAGTLQITLSDTSPAITVAATNYGADAVAIGAITNTGVVTVSGTASQVAAIASSLAATNAVGNVAITDSAADIAANLPALETLANAGKLQVTLNDTSIAANLVTPLLAISGSLTNGVPVVDTAAQLAALAESSTQAATYLNTYGATLSTSGSLDVADATALEGLTRFSLGGNTLSVWDTASHLVAAGAGVLTNGNISGVYLKTTNGTATLTAATAASLLAIPNYSSSNPPGIGGTNTLIVSDTAAHLASDYATLLAHLAQITGGVQVNANATVTDAVLTELQSLHATAAGGVSLTVRDTAANIAANAATQAASAYIVPAAWQLSGNATVTEAQAALLGGLSGFSAGAYTLTLSLSGTTAISLADAAHLGNIAASLSLGGHVLTVAGNASQLDALSSNALNLVTPQLTDTFSNILGVSNTLALKGSVTVSDSESISTAQATSFLNMLTTEGGSIHPASLTFANNASEAITDTIQNLQSLQATAAWTSNSSLHGAFSFVAADTVAHLIAGGSTAYLETLSGSTLSGNETTDPASAETLALMANEIHFAMGSNVLTISGDASDLLDPNYAEGLALAGAVELSGAATVDAADAESLLAIDHFTLNQSLTIEDSSENLLDGVLSGDIGSLSSYVHVELAGSETVDAETAASLVALTGFEDPNGYLNIADSSSYLLASANLTAEEIASSVTLAGDETVSANTVLRLSEVPHFVVGDNVLTLASNDYADAATLKAIGDLGSHFSPGGHSITVTAETLDLTPAEFSALQSDNLAQSGHVVAAISDASNTLTISGLGVTGDTIKIYDDSGNLVGSTGISAGSFTVTAADSGMSHNFAITDVSNGTESAPVVVLDANSLVTAVSQAGASFASYGEIQVGNGQYLNIYQSSASLPSAPALVYNATTHVISLDIPDHSPVTLVTLGGSTLPSSLSAAEIFIKHHS